MHALYLFSVWVHILAAIVWVGGMFFIVLIVVPLIRKGGTGSQAVGFLHDAALRLRTIGWVCFGLVLVTGTYNLHHRGVELSMFADAAWMRSPFGKSITHKLCLFGLTVVLSAVHDFWVGPEATRVMQSAPASPEAHQWRKRASWMGRLNALLALALVAYGVMIVRGMP